MKNKLTDLNDYLFAQIERLSDEDKKPEEVEAEIKRAQALVQVADKIIDNASLQLDAVKFVAVHGGGDKKKLPPSMGLIAGTETPAPAQGGSER